MPAIDELQRLIARTNRDFDDWSDFFEHSKAVWRGFQFWVIAGHRLTSENTATGKKFTEADLVGLSQYYITENLAPIALQRFISVFEIFVFDFLRILLVQNPGQLSAKQLTLADLLAKRRSSTAIEDFITEAVDQRLDRLRYASPKEWFEFINKTEKLGCPSNDEIEYVSEIKARRDVMEHNAGVANQIYLLKAGGKASFVNGDYVVIPDDYLRNSWDLLKKICNDVTRAALKVLPKE
jgi:hypothetical protein